MKRIARLAVAASVLLAIGLFATWITLGSGSTNIAFAAVADALDNLRSATFDVTMEMKFPTGKEDKPPVQMKGKGMFLAPSRQRMEVSQGSTKSVVIMDMQAAKSLMLMPDQKMAIAIDAEKIRKEREKSNDRSPQDMFEIARQLVRDGRDGSGGKVESLGQKEVDGRMAVGFQTHNNVGDMTYWADSRTAQPVRIELAMPNSGGHGVMSNFRYDVELDTALFSVEPPPGYTVQNMDVAVPVEEDLINTLRLVAEHNDGAFPAAIGMNKEFMQAVQAVMKPEMDELKPELDKIAAEHGKESPEAMKLTMRLALKQQKHMQGVMFYGRLNPAKNDTHYLGGGVKLDTPDRPIFWYKPTGSDKYRVIYADLSVKEMSPDEVKNLPEATSK